MVAAKVRRSVFAGKLARSYFLSPDILCSPMSQASSPGRCCWPLSLIRCGGPSATRTLLGLALHGWCIRRRSLGPRLGLHRCVGQALATEAIAERIRSGGVWEAESNIKLLGLVPAPAAADWDAPFTVERVKF